ncbi:MAG: fibronectin type III domain-containing protein [Acidobacteriota bacterium]|nr:fibronectin type III domain-containing protein [Acidobacteriota bacterium]
MDSRSAEFISFIGAADSLHPDFGGLESPGSQNIYGMPYAVVGADQAKVAVEFDYASESDGVNHQTGQSYPFYPIPEQAITDPYWMEGGPPGNANVGGDRHMLIVDRDNRHLYELYALRWTGTRWEAGSGAFFNVNSNTRRPEGWTSADAAGLAILPGLVRYDEAFAADEMRHALRVTVHGVSGYVWPASHRADTNAAGPPLGARMRLKAGTNISGYPAYIQKIFRAMQTYGLIVADTGSDLFVSGVFDTRWNNDELNPAFRAIRASDFEFIERGWRGTGTTCTSPDPPALAGSSTGLTASLTWSPAPTGGAPDDYLLEAGDVPGGSNLASVAVPAPTTSFAATSAAGTYYVRVRARNRCGTAASNEVVLTLASSCVAPGAPGQPVASVAGSSVSVSWAAGAGATSHVFEVGSLPALANLVNTETTSVGLDAQAPPGVYFVRARGRNACGTGPASPETMIAVGCAAPGSATPLSHAVSGSRVSLAWAAADAAIDYVLEAGTSPGAADVAQLPVGTTSFAATAPPGTYYVRVRPRSACGSGAWSNEVVVSVR